MPKPDLSGIALSYCAQFPHAATLTLARKLHKDEPQLFATVERARDIVRYVRGNHGAGHRRSAARKTGFRPNGCAGTGGITPIPPGKRQLDAWEAVTLRGALRALVLSDAHIPYHDADALMVALEDGYVTGVDTIILNGDWTDHYALSRFEKDPRRRNFVEEVDITRTMLAGIRKDFPSARFLWKLGNHEERYEQYLKRTAPDLLGLDVFDFKQCYGLDELRIELVRDKRPILLGELTLIHGHEYTFSFMGPVNPARGLFTKANVHALCGHHHRSSQHSETNLHGKVISTFSTGCLSELHPEYRPINNWNLGYAIVEVGEDGAFEVSNRRIIDGHAY